MRNFLIRVIINAIGIAITAQLLPGITVADNDIGTLLIIGLVFGIVNALVKPILMILTCPAVILSLGLFILVINGLMLLLTASLIPARLTVDGLGPAILGGIVMGIISIILEALLGVNDKNGGKKEREVIVIERR
ncbi:MAG: phage holin family protein [Chloroflexi bacterium]|nr:phage holin family protein [Chloroflexota bacterium]MDL1883866.1 phage holin family protein [Anaerolineae bacterium CFX8]